MNERNIYLLALSLLGNGEDLSPYSFGILKDMLEETPLGETILREVKPSLGTYVHIPKDVSWKLLDVVLRATSHTR